MGCGWLCSKKKPLKGVMNPGENVRGDKVNEKNNIFNILSRGDKDYNRSTK